MSPGPSTVIAKAVIEQFCPRFLPEVGVLLLSDSSEKVVSRDDELAKELGLSLDAARTLPDIVLVDMFSGRSRIVFVEVVATDGAVTEARKRALTAFAESGGYRPNQLLFVTAFLDRAERAFRRLVSEIAWDSYAWFVAEPDQLLHFQPGPRVTLSSELL
jgi:hypothetical protein